MIKAKLDVNGERNWIGTYKCVEEGTRAVIVSRSHMILEATHRKITIWIGCLLINKELIPHPENRLKGAGLYPWDSSSIKAGIWDNDGNFLDQSNPQWGLKEAVMERSS